MRDETLSEAASGTARRDPVNGRAAIVLGLAAVLFAGLEIVGGGPSSGPEPPFPGAFVALGAAATGAALILRWALGALTARRRD
ncbi:MAG: hypothetical protein AAF726_07470 [Planctomycetota bacterium]